MTTGVAAGGLVDAPSGEQLRGSGAVINCAIERNGTLDVVVRVKPRRCRFYNYSLPPYVTVSSMGWRLATP